MLAANTLTACDDDGETFILSVNDVAVTTAEDTDVFVRLPVRKNGEIEATVTLQPSHGALEQVEPENWKYTPAADYNGTDMIEVTFERGPRTAVGKATITITPINDAPVAVADSFAGGFGQPTTIARSTLLMNDTDIDNTNTELAVSGVIDGQHGTAIMDGDNIIFTPEANFQGAATFQYVLTDGGTTTAGDVTVTIGGNTPPVAVNDTATIAEDGTLAISAATLVANDTDANNQTLAVGTVSDATNGTVTLTGGVVRFVPTANFSGAASFAYTVTDGAASSTATVAVTVTPVNDDPVASSDVATTPEDTTLMVPVATLLANDSDPDATDTLTVVGVNNAQNGTASFAAGVATFTPAANFTGLAGFDYNVSDGTVTMTAHVTVQVTPANDPPVAVDDSRGGVEDVATAIPAATLVTNDMDLDGDNLQVTAVGSASVGSVSLAGTTITVTAPANYNGLLTFEYTVSDGVAQDTGLVTVLVAAANDTPVATDDTGVTPEDTAVSIPVLANDSDIDGDTLFIGAVMPPAHGTVSVAGTTISYMPAANYVGPDSFTYVARDASGSEASATVTVTVSPVNDNPTAITDVVAMDAGTTYPIAVLENDFDVDGDSVILDTATLPLHGTYVIANGIISYTPTPGYDGVDTFDYRIVDGNGGLAQGTVTITIFPGTAICGDDIVSGNEECDPGFDEGTVVFGGSTYGGPTFNNCDPETCRFRCATGTGAREVQFDSDTANCYAHYQSATGWTAARDACTARGGHLATVTGFSEELTTEYLTDDQYSSWIGASGSGFGAGSASFSWVTSPDESFQYSDWGSGAPNSSSTQCVQIDAAASWWDDRSCTETHAYICEFEAGLWAHGSFDDDLAGEFEFRMQSPRIADRNEFDNGEGYSVYFGGDGGKLDDDEIYIEDSGGGVSIYYGDDVTWGALVSALNSWAATNLAPGVAPIVTLTNAADAATQPSFSEGVCELTLGWQMPFFENCYTFQDL